MRPEAIKSFRLTRFEFRRDRDIGDSQVRFAMFHGFALELTDHAGRTGLGFAHALWDPLPSLAALDATFTAHLWPRSTATTPPNCSTGSTAPVGATAATRPTALPNHSRSRSPTLPPSRQASPSPATLAPPATACPPMPAGSTSK